MLPTVADLYLRSYCSHAVVIASCLWICYVTVFYGCTSVRCYRHCVLGLSVSVHTKKVCYYDIS